MFKPLLRQPLLRGLSLLLLCGSAAAQTDISGTIFDGNGGPLLSGQIYHVISNVTIPAGQTLTVQGGAIVKFNFANRFDVFGALVVEGTAGNEVVFTSILDDTQGGDSAADGPTVGSPSDWEAISLQTGSSGTVIDYALICFSGGFGFAGLESKALDFVLRDSTIQDGGSSAIDLNIVAGSYTVERNDLRNCSRYAVENTHVDVLAGFLDNTASGNTLGNMIRVSSGLMTSSLTLDPRNGIDGTIVSSVNVSVPAGEILQLEQGLIWKWESIGNRLDVAGAVIANGTLGNPVVFTSGADDDFGSDAFNNGPTSGAKGDWEGINLLPGSSGSTMENTLIRYSGAFGFAAVECTADDFTLRDSTIEEGSSSAIDLNNKIGSFQVERNAFLNCSRYAIENTNINVLPGFIDNTASGNTLGDVVRVSSAILTGDLTIGPRNGIGNTLDFTASPTVVFGQTLQLEPGTICKLESAGLRFDIQGTILCLGTPRDPVILTSSADDEFGVDVRNDGPTVGAPGEWEGINLTSSSSGSIIDHALIRYSGAFGFSGIASAALDFELTNTIIEFGSFSAVDLKNVSGNNTIKFCDLRDCLRYAVENCHIDVIPGFSYNRASGNSLGDYQRISSGILSSDVTLSRENLINGVLVTAVTLTVPVGRTMTIEPGVIIKFSSSGLRVDIFGEFFVNGTGRDPVVFTSLADDDHGGDTNLDGPSSGLPGQWEGILSSFADVTQIEHALIRFGGAFGFAGLSLRASAIAGDIATVDSTRVESCNAAGFNLEGVTADASNLVAFQNLGNGIETRAFIFDLLHASSIANFGVGITNVISGATQIENSISWNNGGMNFSGFATSDLFFCNGDSAAAGSNGNIFSDPLFINEGEGDLNLSGSSPCQDSADFATALEVELDHVENSRLLDPTLSGVLRADMGAYERSLWSVDEEGGLIHSGRMRHTVNGPSGNSIYLIGLLDGSTLASPFGVITAGTTSLTSLGSTPVGTQFVVIYPTDGSLIGTEIGVQTLTSSQADPSVGGITQLVRRKLRPAIPVDRTPTSL